MDIYIKKYRGTNYFYDAVFLDEVHLTRLPEESFPVSNFETEAYPFTGGSIDPEKIGKQQTGDFTININLIDKTTSTLGKSLREFFVYDEDEESYFYMVIVKIDNFYMCGMTLRELYRASLTWAEGKDNVYLSVFEPIVHWARKVDRAPLSTLNNIMSNGAIYTFEQYILKHFTGLTSGKVLFKLPEQSYLQHLQPYGNPAGCWAYGDFFQFINDRDKISRWEAFKELKIGIGFNYNMYINPGSELYSEPEFIFEIFFLADYENEEPYRLEKVITHDEEGLPVSAKWVYMKYRGFEKDGINYSSGIIFSKNNMFDADPDNANDELYPSLLQRLDGRLLSYDEGNGALINLYEKDEFLEIPMKQYSYSHASGGGIGRLADPNPVTNGGYTATMAYSKIFNAATGSGTNIDRYNHKPIQRFAIKNYKRFLDYYGRSKVLGVSLIKTDRNVFLPWKNIIINEGNGDKRYFVAKLNDLDLWEAKATITLKRY